MFFFFFLFSGFDSFGIKTSENEICQKIIDIDIFHVTQNIGGQIPGVILENKYEEKRTYGIPCTYRLILKVQEGLLKFSKKISLLTNKGNSSVVSIIGTLDLLNEILESLFYLPFSNYYGMTKMRISPFFLFIYIRYIIRFVSVFYLIYSDNVFLFFFIYSCLNSHYFIWYY